MKLAPIVVGMFALCVSSALADPLLSMSAFRDAAIAHLHELDANIQVEVLDESGLRLTKPDDPSFDMQMGLDNAYDEYVHAPDTLDKIVDHYTRFAITPHDDTSVRENLVVILRTRWRLEPYEQSVASGSPPSHLVRRPWLGDLEQVVVFDTPQAVGCATPEQLQALGLSEEQAWTLALSQSQGRLGDMQYVTDAPGFVIVGGGNGMAPSALLAADFCGGDHAGDFVLAYARDAYLIADHETRGASNVFHSFVRDMIASGQSESATPLVCRNGHLEAESD